MIEKDNVNDCKVFDKYISDDISISKIYLNNNDTITIADNDNRQTTVDMATINSSIETLINPKLATAIPNVWYPIFITKDNSQIKYKNLAVNGVIKSNPLGLEDQISFVPTLNSLRLDGDAKIAVDWIINSVVTPFTPEYGVLFWFKKRVTLPNDDSKFKITDLPIGSIISPANTLSYNVMINGTNITFEINPSTKLVKKDNNKLYILNNSSLRYDTNKKNVFPNNILDYFNLNTYIANSSNTNIDNILFTINNTIDSFGTDIELWISHGETYSYSNSNQIKINDYSKQTALKSYLSPVLYPQYREIYNTLTSGITRTFKAEGVGEDDNLKIFPKPLVTLKQSRLLKKLSHVLATGPLLDRVGSDVLNNKRISQPLNNIIDTYINTDVASVAQEQTLVYNTVVEISKLFKIYNSSAEYAGANSIITSSNMNYIKDNKDLFKMLWFKYGGILRIYSTGTIKLPATTLKYGPNFKLSHDVMSKCLTTIKDTTVYNNLTITSGKLLAKTVISAVDTQFLTKNLDGGPDIITKLADVDRIKLLKDPGLPNSINITVGPDIDLIFPEPDNPRTAVEMQHTIDDASSDVDNWFNDGGIFDFEPLSVEWSRISGYDCLRFSDFNLSRGIAGGERYRYITSSDPSPTLYIKKPGKYTLQLKVKHSLGIVYMTKIIHVIGPGYDRPANELLRPKAEETLGIENGLVSICPNLREFAFSKNGIFWPMYSELNIEKQVPIFNDKYEMFGGASTRIAFPMPDNYIRSLPNLGYTGIDLKYECTSTIIDIKRITVSYMIDNKKECNQCLSFNEYIVDNKNATLNVDSTRSTNSTVIRSYGNFSQEIIDDLQINIPGHPAPRTPLMSVTGVEPNRLTSSNDITVKPVCRQDYIHYSGGIISGIKGVFHPQSGWFNNTNNAHNAFKNRSAVLRFRTEDRPHKIFKGLGFNDLSHDFLDSEPKILKSAITLNVTQKAYDCADHDGCKIESLVATDFGADTDDHSRLAGYRDNSGKFGKSLFHNDEYDYSFTIKEKSYGAESYCDTSTEDIVSCVYTTMKPGSYIPVSERAQNQKLRYYRGTSNTVEDVSVRLNYLNYANPKDLVVWLEADPCGSIERRLCPPKSSSMVNRFQHMTKQLWNDSMFTSVTARPSVDENMKITSSEPDHKKLPDLYQKYLDSLILLNSNTQNSTGTCIRPDYKLYLLNQDHIHYFNLNDQIIFSDQNALTHFSTNNNIGKSLNLDQQLSTALQLAPTLTSTIYNDYKNQLFKNVLINNRLINPDLKFMKFHGLPLFTPAPVESERDPPPPPPPANSDSTTFSLCIAIMNESDDIAVYDRIMATDYLVGNQLSYNREISTLLTNSLCSWDLMIGDSDYDADGITSKISYKYPRNIRYKLPMDGYSFMLDFNRPKVIGTLDNVWFFRDKKHLIPPININAPYSNILNPKKCKYSVERLNVPRIYPAEPLNIPLFVFAFPFSIVGAIATTIGVDSALSQQAAAIVDYLKAQRQNRINEYYSDALYVPSYNEYSTGEPDKALINISKNGDIWYKLEASIFKYNNCPILRPKKYKYVKLGWDGLLRNFSIFNFQKFSNNMTDIFDEKLIKKIYIDNKDNTDLVDLVDDTYYFEEETILSNYSTLISSLTSKNLLSNINILNAEKKRLSELPSLTEDQLKTIAAIDRGIDHYQKTISSIGYELEEGDVIELVDEDPSDDINENTNEDAENPPDETNPTTPSRNIYVLYSQPTTNEAEGDEPPPEGDEAAEQKSGTKFTTFADLLLSKMFVSQNNIYNNLFYDNISLRSLPIFEDVPEDPIAYNTFLNNKIYHRIILNGLRPYNFFQTNDPVDIFAAKEITSSIQLQINTIDNQIRTLEISARNQTGDALKETNKQIALKNNEKWGLGYTKTSNTILKTGWFKKSDKYYTILELQTAILPATTIISKPISTSDTFFVYSDDKTTISRDVKSKKDNLIPLNIWPHNIINQKDSTQSPDDNISTFSAGSYGTGSAAVRPYKLSSIPNEKLVNPLLSNDIRQTNIKEEFNCFGYNFEEINNVIKKYPYSVFSDSSIVSSIIKLNENQVFVKNEQNYNFFDVRDTNLSADLLNITYPNNTSYDGYVNYGLEKILLVNKFDQTQVNTLKDRLNYITSEINQLKIEIVQYQKTNKSRIPNTLDLALNAGGSLNIDFDKQIKLLLHEYYEIIYYLEICGATDVSVSKTNRNFTAYAGVQADEPHIIIDFTEEVGGDRLLFTETVNNNKYWINIDPEQSCSIDQDASIKILDSVSYKGSEKNLIDVPRQITSSPDFADRTLVDGIEHDGMLINDRRELTGNIQYDITEEKLNEEKAKYPNITEWTKGGLSIDRSYFVNNLGNSINSLITVRYTYTIPKTDNEKTLAPVSDNMLENKVYNIFNLDNVMNIKVKFKRIPRQLKDSDTDFDRYIPDDDGKLTKSLKPAPGGTLDNNMKIWKCIDRNTGASCILPAYYSMANEMVFRAFFGSADAVEHGGQDFIRSREDSAWIPYGYGIENDPTNVVNSDIVRGPLW